MDLFGKATLVKAYKDIFATEAGKLVLKDLVREGGVLRNSYRGNKEEMLINEGKRNMLLYILANTKTDLKAILELAERQSKENLNG
jgi:hypothetical protein